MNHTWGYEVSCRYCPTGTIKNTHTRCGNIVTVTGSTCSNKDCKGKQPTDEEKAIKAAIAAFTAKERIAYFILTKYIDALYEAGVDVSYFPKQAEIVTINAAKDMVIAVENADDAIL